ncbi:MAG: dual specificity protein phosphatase [Planctomycetota bacterium]|nr:dual specificity protein phosphatase [Planctomycetota bacterium]
MHQLPNHSLWIGNAAEARDRRLLGEVGIKALVDLALEEPPALPLREITYCRFPLLDGAGNEPWLLENAIQTVARLLKANVPTLVSCSVGMSRSPAIVAAALATIRNISLEGALAEVTQNKSTDLSPGLWQEVKAAMRQDFVDPSGPNRNASK